MLLLLSCTIVLVEISCPGRDQAPGPGPDRRSRIRGSLQRFERGVPQGHQRGPEPDPQGPGIHS
jgi:hypothetical protein